MQASLMSSSSLASEEMSIEEYVRLKGVKICYSRKQHNWVGRTGME